MAANTASKDLTGLTAGTAYTFSAYSDSSCSTLLATASEFTTSASLTASSVTGTGATLTLAGHTGDWYYQANTGTDATCSTTAETGTTKTLSSLTAGTVYAYTAYSASGCASASRLATAVFGTPTSVSVSNISETATGGYPFGLNTAQAQEFTTGSAAGGYALSSVRVDFLTMSNASAVTVAIHGVQSNGTPETAARATLTGTAGTGQRTFTCTAGSNNNCALDADTSYFVLVDASAASAGQVSAVISNAQTLSPSGNGWSIADDSRQEAWNWTTDTSSLRMTVSATAAASASLAATSTSLTISDYTGAWYYQANAAPHAACSLRRQHHERDPQRPHVGHVVHVLGLRGQHLRPRQPAGHRRGVHGDRVQRLRQHAGRGSVPELPGGPLPEYAATGRASLHHRLEHGRLHAVEHRHPVRRQVRGPRPTSW